MKRFGCGKTMHRNLTKGPFLCREDRRFHRTGLNFTGSLSEILLSLLNLSHSSHEMTSNWRFGPMLRMASLRGFLARNTKSPKIYYFQYESRMETVDRSSASAAVDLPSSISPDRQSGNSLESPQTKQTKALKMAKKSMLKAKDG